MNASKYIFIGVLLGLMSACNSPEAPDCFKSAGDEILEERTLASFQRMEIEDRFEIILIQDNDSKVRLQGPRNVLSKVKTQSEDGTLFISNDNTCNFVRSFKNTITLYIHSPWIKEIQNRGTGNIHNIDTLHFPYLKIENRNAAGAIDLLFEGDSLFAYTQTGVADFNLRGRVKKAELFNQGLGVINASMLESQETYINNNSINDISAYSSGYLFAINSSKGNIFIFGSPTQTDIFRNGSGAIEVY